MDSQIQDHLERLVKFTNALKEISRTSKKEFLENQILQSASYSSPAPLSNKEGRLREMKEKGIRKKQKERKQKAEINGIK